MNGSIDNHEKKHTGPGKKKKLFEEIIPENIILLKGIHLQIQDDQQWKKKIHKIKANRKPKHQNKALETK